MYYMNGSGRLDSSPDTTYQALGIGGKTSRLTRNVPIYKNLRINNGQLALIPL
jgi:hypothetical protein